METCVETPFHSQNNQPTNKGEEAINKNQVLYGLNALLHAKIVRQLLLQKKKQFWKLLHKTISIQRRLAKNIE